jgi:hypothetical protein
VELVAAACKTLATEREAEPGSPVEAAEMPREVVFLMVRGMWMSSEATLMAAQKVVEAAMALRLKLLNQLEMGARVDLV